MKNYTDKNKTDSSILSSSVSRGVEVPITPLDRMDKTILQVRKQITYESIVGLSPEWREYADNIVTIIADVNMLNGGKVIISQRNLDTVNVQQRYGMLRQAHVEYVIERFIHTAGEIGNPLAYLRTALYNAPSTVDISNTQEVRSVMAKHAQR